MNQVDYGLETIVFLQLVNASNAKVIRQIMIERVNRNDRMVDLEEKISEPFKI